jgi:hypothetical protein
MKYRKKPVVVEAEQFVIWNYFNVPKVVNIMGVNYEVKGESFDRYIEIPTLEGIMKAKCTDYIIKGVKGEFYPCDQDVFRMTYEQVE